MKKYLFTLLPLAVCWLLALLYGHMEAYEGLPGYGNEYRSEGTLQYLASRWFLIGLVMSVMLFAVIAIEDLFSWFERRRKRRLAEK